MKRVYYIDWKDGSNGKVRPRRLITFISPGNARNLPSHARTSPRYKDGQYRSISNVRRVSYRILTICHIDGIRPVQQSSRTYVVPATIISIVRACTTKTNVMMQIMVAKDTVMIRAFVLLIWLQIRIGTSSKMITIIAIKIRARYPIHVPEGR